MSLGSNPARAQRLVLAGLIATMALSAALLWLLDSRTALDRGAGPRAETEPPPPAERTEPARPAGEPRAAEDESERVALEPAGTSSTGSDADETFDPRAISGQVLLENEPVPGAELVLFAGALERRMRRTPLAEARSDEGGRFRFRELEPHERYTVLVQSPAALPEERALFPGHAEEIELERAATVSGTVRSAVTGEPLAGVEVALERWHWDGTGLAERVAATTASGGRWQLPWAEPGMQQFLVEREGALPERREFQVAEEGGDGYDIELGEALALELELYSLESGSVLAGTEFLWEGVPARTDARGRCGLPLPPGGFADEWLRLSAAPPGGCVTQGRVKLEDVHGTLRVPLARGGAVRGRVVDAAGLPVEGAIVRMSGSGRVPAGLGLPEGFWLNPSRAPARTGADGRFELTGLPPREGEVELHAQHPAHPPGLSEPFSFSRLGEEVELEIALAAGGTIAGHVRLDGEPAALFVYWSSAEGGGWTRADDRGAYALRGVPAGEVQVRARLEDEDEGVPRAEDLLVQVEEGRTASCNLDLASGRARIRGRVLDAAGAPVADARLVAYPVDEDAWQGEEPRARSGDDGRFELSVPDVAALAFHVWARSGPREAVAESVPAGAADVELVLPVLTRVALRVIDAEERRPVQGFQLYWRDSAQGEYVRLDQGGRRLSPGPDGLFLAELPAGRLDLAVSARSQGYVPARRDGVELFPEGSAVLEFELERGAELVLEFRVPDDAPEALGLLQRGRVSIASEEQWRERERGGDFFQQEVRNAQALRVDPDGRARVRALASGTYSFFNGPKGYEFRPRQFELLPVAEHLVTVALERAEKPPGKKPKAGGN